MCQRIGCLILFIACIQHRLLDSDFNYAGNVGNFQQKKKQELKNSKRKKTKPTNMYLFHYHIKPIIVQVFIIQCTIYLYLLHSVIYSHTSCQIPDCGLFRNFSVIFSHKYVVIKCQKGARLHKHRLNNYHIKCCIRVVYFFY